MRDLDIFSIFLLTILNTYSLTVADAYAKYAVSFKRYFWLQQLKIDEGDNYASVADFTLTFKFVGVDNAPYPDIYVVLEEFNDFAFRISSVKDVFERLDNFLKD